MEQQSATSGFSFHQFTSQNLGSTAGTFAAFEKNASMALEGEDCSNGIISHTQGLMLQGATFLSLHVELMQKKKNQPKTPCFVKLSTTEVTWQECDAQTTPAPEVSSSKPPTALLFHTLHFQVPHGPRHTRSRTHGCGYQLCNSMENLHALFIYNGKQLSNKIK